jgi:methylenetetrahydrofolate dehydrogenase (NAD+)
LENFLLFVYFVIPPRLDAMDPTICLTVTGAAVAKSFKEAVQAYTATAPRRPKLLGILASSNAPSRRYAEWTKKACEAVGIEYVLLELCKDGDATAGQGEVEESILAANVDASVNGIMVYVSPH